VSSDINFTQRLAVYLHLTVDVGAFPTIQSATKVPLHLLEIFEGMMVSSEVRKKRRFESRSDFGQIYGKV
jgi:hypothetical protein